MNGIKLNFVVITSINTPTLAVREFSKWLDFKLVVVGDLKSPRLWVYPGAEYLSHSSELVSKFEIYKSLRSNHYSRKMLGYLYAIKNGATLIYDTDDDNIPRGIGFHPDFIGSFELVSTAGNFYNVYKDFTDARIWPRGFPIEDLNSSPLEVRELNAEVNVGIWQGLVDQDPDVDAIYRLLFPGDITFTQRPPVVLDKLTWSPFNSQNTFFSVRFFPCLYLPTGVSFRYTDILRSIVTQPILWNEEATLGFFAPDVFQVRNEHNLMSDFESEIPMHLTIKRACEVALDSVKSNYSPAENLISIYKGLAEEEIVPKEELQLVHAWVNDLERIM